MIPHKLSLRNFMCYRDDVPTLLFDGLNVVCLSGENGAGKSTLLDAMTWALWGKARGKSDDDLIALGQDEMEVDFEFVLDGVLRRVIRRRTKGKRGQSLVDFQVCDGDGSWKRISGDGVRDTDAQITAALRMSYETFVNSAFLLQGRADEFTTRKPAERKQVLADILGLAEYERLEARAREKRTACDAEMRYLAGLIEEYQRQTERRPFLEGEVQRATVEAEQWDADLAGAETSVQRLRAAAEHLRRIAEEHARLDARVASDAVELEALCQEIIEHESKLVAADEVIARQAEIEAGVRAFDMIAGRLEDFEVLREEAVRLNLIRKDAQSKLDTLRVRIEAELKSTNDEADRLRAHAANRDQCARELQTLATDARVFAGLRQDAEQTRAQIAALDELVRRITALHRERDQIEKRMSQYERIRDLQRVAEPLQHIEQRIDVVAGRLRELSDLERRRPGLEKQLKVASTEHMTADLKCQQVKADGADVKRTIDALKAGVLICPQCGQPLAGDARERMLVDHETKRASLLDVYRELSATLARAEATMAAADQELKAIAEAAQERETLVAEHATLREQQRRAAAAVQDLARLGDDARDGDDLATELAFKDEAIAQLGDLREVEAELGSARVALAELEARLQGERALDKQRAGLEERLRASTEALAQLPAVEARGMTLERQLADEAYGQEDRAERDEARAGLDRIQAQGYSSDAHNALKHQYDEHKHWPGLQHELRQAFEKREIYQAARERTAELVARRSADLDAARQALLSMSGELRKRPIVEADLSAAERSLIEVKARQRLAQEELGRAKQDLATCGQYEELLEGYRAQHAALADERGVYEELALAFGKRGIQAMLIETAIPELEHDSNILLARMTDNQMHLSFETQRDSKKGDTIETLDIRIADGLGTRDYSMFSGGEAFRVNFAVRVALSKLLAHRADANLKTLVIDEGFGTQDTNGRDRIVEAINAVSHDFERILVVTHIQELKDLFPTQIEVTKGSAGSTWRLV